MNDPGANFLSSLGEFYLQGLQAWQNAARGALPEAGRATPSGTARPGSGPLADLGQTFAAMAASAQASFAENFTEYSPDDAGTLGNLGDMVPALGQAWMIAAASALRYGQGLLEVQTRYQSTLLRGGAPGDRLSLDAFRGFLREVGETAEREARRLQLELALLGEKVARDAAPAAPDQANPRPYRAKE